jgi:hypothetical protein
MMVNPNHDPRESKRGMERVAFKLFIAGFFLLPLVWFANFVYFFRSVRSPDAPPRAKLCKPLFQL